MGFTICAQRGNYRNGITQHSAVKINKYGEIVPRELGKEYFNRLWLVGVIKEFEKMSFEDMLKEFKIIYEKVKRSNNPIDIIRQQGLKYGTIPA
jgi:hypothetical protein